MGHPTPWVAPGENTGWLETGRAEAPPELQTAATAVTDVGIIGQMCAGVIVVARLPRTHEGAAKRAVRAVAPGRHTPVQVWTFAPDVPYLVGALDEECFVPYCVDEYTQFKGSESDRIAAAENELIDRADVVVTTSTWLEGTGRQPVPSG